MQIIRSIVIFLLAGLCEIGGGYLVWLWLRECRSIWFAVLGVAVLVLYGIIPTLQPANFGRVYAAYWGNFHCSLYPLGLEYSIYFCARRL